MSQEFDIAILDVTEIVGEAILDTLQERQFPVGQVYLLASEAGSEKSYRFNGKSLSVESVEDFDWSQVHIAFFTAGESESERWAQVAADEGVVVIDNTAQFRYEYDVPLVIPQVNPEAIGEFRNRNIIANPGSLTVQMLRALKPIHDAVGIERINVSTYQSVSCAGKSGIDELAGQTAKLLNGIPAEPDTFAQRIAFNCIPQVDALLDNGYSREEMKMVWETQKLLNDPSVMVNPTCVVVPVFYGHAQSIQVETRSPITAEEVAQLLDNTEGVTVCHGDSVPTPVGLEDAGDNVLVGRIREDISHHSGINLWVVADNVRTGSAQNAVQIAERLVNDHF